MGSGAPKKPRECAWKKLYIKRDAEDMVEFVRNCPTEFKEYYIQMQAAKRSQAPLPSQITDDSIILDKTVADQVSLWKKSKGLGDKVVPDHACSGETCAYHQIGDVFVCEKTGYVHVCDDTCREVVLDPTNGLLVCTISGHCIQGMMLLAPHEVEPDVEQLQAGATDEAEVLTESGHFALGMDHLLLVLAFPSFGSGTSPCGSAPKHQLKLMYWDITAMMRRNWKLLCAFADSTAYIYT